MEVMLSLLLSDGYNRIDIERLVEVAATNIIKWFDLNPNREVIRERPTSTS